MAENDAVRERGAEPADDAPSLELPSLFGRRKKRSKNPPVEPPTAEAEPPVVEAEPPTLQAEPPTVQEYDAEQTTAVPVATAPLEDTQLLPREVPAEPPVVEAEPPLAVAEPPLTEAEEDATATGATGDDLDDEPEPRKRRTPPRLPALAASTAAVAVGAVVGLLGCVLTFLGLKGCALVTSTSSCGGPGLLVLIVIVVVMILAGAALLRLFTVEDAANLSFLGVGITVAAVLIFLLGYLYQPWMFLVLPVLTAAGFLLARWITTRYVDDVLAEDDVDVHDIR